jgi:mercuric ion transport protein
MSSVKRQLGMLATAGLATILASSCCVGPLLLVSIGLGGAWVSKLQVLEPYKPIFLGLAAIAMIFAYRRIYRPVADCSPGEICALPRTQLIYKGLFWLVLLLIGLTLAFPYFAHYFY